MKLTPTQLWLRLSFKSHLIREFLTPETLMPQLHTMGFSQSDFEKLSTEDLLKAIKLRGGLWAPPPSFLQLVVDLMALQLPRRQRVV